MVVHLFLNNNKALDFLPINSIKNGGITSAYQPSRFENHATLFMHKAMPSEKKVSDGIGVEARTTRACVPHTPYAWVLDFMQATACYI